MYVVPAKKKVPSARKYTSFQLFRKTVAIVYLQPVKQKEAELQNHRIDQESQNTESQ